MSARLRRLRSDDGGIIVAAAIIMLSLILLGAVVIQVGSWFQNRRHLQVRADAGALAAAQLFNECFVQGIAPATAQTDMQDWANRYAGFSSPVGTPENAQFGTGNSSALFQSTTYPGGGGPGADDTNTANVCDPGSLAFDVKLRQNTIKGLFSISPLATVYAHARVQLKEVKSIVPSFPLAVPHVVPSVVGVTFINEDSNTELTGCTGTGLVPGTSCTYSLHNDATPGSDPFNLGPWTIQGAGVNLPNFAAGDGAVKHIGMRVGVGDLAQSCVGPGNGSTWQCYNADPANLNHGVVMIDEVNPTQTGPKLQGVWPTTCSGHPFAGNDSLPDPCAATITAKIDFGAVAPSTATVNATVTQSNVPNGTSPQTINLTYDPTSGLWSAPLATATAKVAVNPATGGSEYAIDLTWRTGGGPSNTGTWPGVQRFVGATDSDDGPLDTVQVTDATAPLGPYSYVGGGSRSLNVSVLLKAPFNKLTILRQAHSGSATAFILCRWKNNTVGVLDNGGSALADSMTSGCQVPYQINATTSCDPDPLPSPEADTNPDCTQNKPCDTCGNTITKALDARFGCKAGQTPEFGDKWPNWATPGDPRAVTLVTTSFGAFGDNGSNRYPVTGFGAFYIAGVTGNACGDDWPLDASGQPILGPYPGNNTGTIWGYFIKYANNDGTPGGRACKVNSFQNCVAVLTR